TDAIRKFLSACKSPRGVGVYSLEPRGPADARATAMGLVCRRLIDGPNAPELRPGTKWLWDDLNADDENLTLEGLFNTLLRQQLETRRRGHFLAPLAPLRERQERSGPQAGSWT